MILRLEDLKNVCNVILSSVDLKSPTIARDTLEMKIEDKQLYLCVTNREYYIKLRIPVNTEEKFHTTVNAQLFLKLISKITTDTVEFTISGNTLIIKGNGTYKLPMIFDGESLLILPEINISNVTLSFDIDGNQLYSISKYNAKQILTGYKSDEIQEMVYVDENGAATFTTGACVNKFVLDKPVKMLLSQKLVKLFSLFKDKTVSFSMGFDANPISESQIQQKVKFDVDDIVITAILRDESTFKRKFPLTAVRNEANSDFDYHIVFNRNELLQVLSRLMLFSNISTDGDVDFYKDYLEVFDSTGTSSEKIYYNNEIDMDEIYKSRINLDTLKSTLDCFTDQYIKLSFGNSRAFVISSGDIYMVIPEGIRNNE